MHIEELKKIIIDQEEEIKNFFIQENIIEREVDTQKFKSFLRSPNILIISGVRRSGKSVLAHLVFKGEKYAYLNFDDERLIAFQSEDFNRLLEAFYSLYGSDIEYFIFDEIQNIQSWQLFITRLRRTKKIIITGSNATLLSGELSTHLTGRYLDFTLYPFSFTEYLKLKGKSPKERNIYSTSYIAQVKRLLTEYIQLGGFPEVYKISRLILPRIYGDIINRDVIFRFKIRNRKTFKEMAKYLISNFAQEIAYSKLRNIFTLKDVHTIKNYIDALSSSFLIFILEKFSYKLKQQYITTKKVYAIDTGLIDSLAFQFSSNFGKLMENAVFIELLRKSSYRWQDTEIYFWKDYQGREVDFVVKRAKKVADLIQVCKEMNSLSIRERELKSLLYAGEKLNCERLTVITWEEEGEEKYMTKTVKFVPLWKWLIPD